jgi:chromosome segregation protein
VEDRLRQVEKETRTVSAECQAAEAQMQAAQQQYDQVRAEADRVEKEVAELELTLRQDEELTDQLQEQLREHAREATAVRVERAKSEQQVGTLRGQLLQFEEDRRERSRAIQEAREQMALAIERRQTAERTILRASSDLARIYLAKEAEAAAISKWLARRESCGLERSVLNDQLNQVRHQLKKIEDKQHKRELAAGEVRHQRATLVERLAEDYGIQIAELAGQAEHEEPEQREAVEEEIASLRRKISNIGAVNMEALDELDELEQRFASLSGQYQDLVQAKQALERIVHKINADSRRLFTETLEAIRTNFQALYRRAFGGGKADIVLEEGVDILECGIEIIATPPGKPSFSNSLLSGGEKALTAVSLLLAIFQYRPSPFCVLDEVDAPFDEANIGRFVDVLKEFLGWTKFVLVTHSKKTMTAANTLYGVTMQESGVSKRVSVRFDDVSEDGQIRAEALQRDEDAA